MKRRTVLGGLAALGLGGAVAAWWATRPAPATSRLVAGLRPLGSDWPETAAAPELLRELLATGAITADGAIAAQRLQELAGSEEVHAIAGWHYSASEIKLHRLAAAFARDGCVHAAGVALMGRELGTATGPDPLAGLALLVDEPEAVAASLAWGGAGWRWTVFAEPLRYQAASDGVQAVLR